MRKMENAKKYYSLYNLFCTGRTAGLKSITGNCASVCCFLPWRAFNIQTTAGESRKLVHPQSIQQVPKAAMRTQTDRCSKIFQLGKKWEDGRKMDQSQKTLMRTFLSITSHLHQRWLIVLTEKANRRREYQWSATMWKPLTGEVKWVVLTFWLISMNIFLIPANWFHFNSRFRLRHC